MVDPSLIGAPIRRQGPRELARATEPSISARRYASVSVRASG